jgi:hypothetical protein
MSFVDSFYACLEDTQDQCDFVYGYVCDALEANRYDELDELFRTARFDKLSETCLLAMTAASRDPSNVELFRRWEEALGFPVAQRELPSRRSFVEGCYETMLNRQGKEAAEECFRYFME